ncbi:MAG: hypothetical protein AAGA23_13595 [Pseudomonadota bacterium]
MTLFVVTAILVSNLGAGVYAEESDAIRLVERNCAECYGAKEEGLRKGIEQLEELAEQGRLSRSGKATLADAYGQFAFAFVQDGTAEQAALIQKRSDTYQSLVESSCFDPAVAYQYAITAPNLEQQEAALDSILEMRSAVFWAAWSKGNLLLAGENQDVDAGIESLKLAAAIADDSDRAKYGEGLADLLAYHGERKTAAEIRARIQETRDSR